MYVPLLDLKLQYASIRQECLAVTEKIYDSQHFILGPYVEKLEEEVAGYCGTRYAVGVSSGTDALLLSLMAAGIGEGDRVITTPYTFFATAGSIARVGAVPVFVDIEPDTYNICPQKLEAAVRRMDEKTRQSVKAVMPVHLYGQCAEMDPINALARENNWVVIEDAAQAMGAEYKGQRAGSLGDFGCFSFFPSKNLGGFGDGGIVTTNSDSYYEMLKILRVHGASPKYYHRYIGGNFRLDAIQAAIVSIKLARLDQWTQKRQENAARYRQLFAEAGIDEIIGCPLEKQDRHIYNQFVISAESKRDALRDFLQAAGVGCEIYYPVCLHMQQCFADLGYAAGQMPEAEAAAARTLAIPVFPELTEDQQAYVAEQIRSFCS
ncbi:dTDP-4-amino-4,6-dideoxygalactose transaminase [Desulfosalsimonas propionicica]|uniref:dTDP-4-amino-4,6-dideoxygalactose transaminase n=1 Tax=Desulfosalsimonas propionicica TaxID=332175 RepID=A0A7W0HM68_9BACT|nr:DegT/DnrJ/EryC1/StrS family aminotransferase [Desulfosalsimonas propionicica]MBA2883055.1 dTDP-4-amino-4,6-dideoxygalactose transaminase [Desulfosalsimonas propionicica]